MHPGRFNSYPLLIWLLTAAIFWSLNSWAEYRAPEIPELKKFQRISPAPVPPPPALGLESPLAAQTSAGLSVREQALESLMSRKLLEQELARVRKMLAETESKTAEPETEPRVAEPTATEGNAARSAVTPAVIQPETVTRLLSTVQKPGTQREELAARTQILKESLAQKDQRYAHLSNAAGGVLFQASLEFNRPARGTSPSTLARRRLLSGRRVLDLDLADAEDLAAGRKIPLNQPARSRLSLSAEAATAAGSYRHRPSYSDSSIKKDDSGGKSGATALDGRHRGSYRSSTIAAYEESKQ